MLLYARWWLPPSGEPLEVSILNRDMHAWFYRHVLHQRTYRTILLSSLNWGTCSKAYSRPMQEVRFSAHHSNRQTTACRSLLATFHTFWPIALRFACIVHTQLCTVAAPSIALHQSPSCACMAWHLMECTSNNIPQSQQTRASGTTCQVATVCR